MAPHIDYYLSLNSPWTFLGSRRFEQIVDRYGASVAVLPVNYGEIFPQTGGQPLPKRAPARQAYRLVELERWSETLGIAINIHPAHFPFPEPLAARLVYAAAESGGAPMTLAHAILKALWVEERDPSDEATLTEIAKETGHAGEELLEKAKTADMEERYAASTQKALDAGVFGAPSYVLNGEIFWGQDRLDFLDRRLAKL
jgi:2-hydroxychromene-2-carboxylate isomerase